MGSNTSNAAKTPETIPTDSNNDMTLLKSQTNPASLKIVMVLDESGSMADIKLKIIKSINDFVMEQQQLKSDGTTMTLLKFSDKLKYVFQRKPLEDIREITPFDYMPDGSTALYDAIGNAIEQFKEESNVIMVIVTDGQENASKNYTRSKITDMINKCKSNKLWNFVYLSSDIDTFTQGNNIGMANSFQSTNYVTQKECMGSYLSQDLSRAVKAQRVTGVNMNSILNKP
jgi:hypothetical protein